MSQNILIVDDEEHIRRLCSEILKRESYQTFTAASAKAAIELSRLQSFDLLLTDISMPGMDGLKLLQTIKDNQKEIASVVMTGYGTIDNAVEAMKLGAQGFVIKPFSREELVQSVGDALERYRLLRENMRLKLLVPLFEVGKTLLSDLHLKSLLETFGRVVLKETRSDAAAVMLVDDRTRNVKAETCLILPDGFSKETFQRVEETLGRWVLEKKTPLVLDEESSLTDEMRSFLHQAGLASVVAFPFVSKDRITGILILCKNHGNASFNQSDLELTSILCGQATIAVENAKLFEVIETKNQELEAFYFETVNALAQAIEVKDVYTGGHGDRLVDFAVSVAERLNVSEEEKIWLKYAAALHDIGKIGVKEAILTKPGKLTPEEYEEMKTHPAKGAEIIKEVKFLAPVVPIVYHHQERYDGKGYPTGLSGHQIPIGSRIVAVLDAFDAMTTNRPYRKGLPTEVAINELRRHSGVQFDPQVVEAFIQAISESPHTA
jgi:response regulator RpfG family c-di-GMP phosphodiesterase